MDEKSLGKFGYSVSQGIVFEGSLKQIGQLENGTFRTPPIYKSRNNVFSIPSLTSMVTEEELSSALGKIGLETDRVYVGVPEDQDSSKDYDVVIRTDKPNLVKVAVELFKEFEDRGYERGLKEMVEGRLRDSLETSKEEINKSLGIITSELMKRLNDSNTIH